MQAEELIDWLEAIAVERKSYGQPIVNAYIDEGGLRFTCYYRGLARDAILLWEEILHHNNPGRLRADFIEDLRAKSIAEYERNRNELPSR